jgi:hypothetical protein
VDRRTVRELHGGARAVLRQARHLASEGHLSAQFREPRVQDFLGPPLGDHPRLRVRRALVRRHLVEHGLLAGPLAVLPGHPGRVRAARRVDRVENAQVVEDLLGPGLDSLAARSGEQRRRALHHQCLHPAPGEVDAEGESGGARSHDQDIHRLSP